MTNIKIITKSSLITIMLFVFCLPIFINNQRSDAAISYTKVGVIEEDSYYSDPYVGYTTDSSVCATTRIVCHVYGNGAQKVDGNRHVWKIPRDSTSINFFWALPHLNVTQDIKSSDSRSYQKICIVAKDNSKSLKKEILDYEIKYKIGETYYTLARGGNFNVSKDRYKQYCSSYRIIGPKTEMAIMLNALASNSISVDKIVLYQGGSGPSVIDEIAAHPFDTGTK